MSIWFFLICKLERLDYARRLERIERIKAEQRMQIGGKENFPLGQTGENRDIVAKYLHFA